MAQYDVDLRDYWRILRKRKFTIIFMVIIVGITSYGAAKLKEPVPLYEASASVKIERGASMAAGIIGGGGFFGATEGILTQAFIIKSFPVLAHAAKNLGWLPKDISQKQIRENSSYLSAIMKLKIMMRTDIEAGTNIINIIVTSSKKEESAFLANTLSNAYREYNIIEKNRQVTDAKEFIESQLSMVERRLKQAEERLKNYKEGYSSAGLSAEMSRVVNEIASSEVSLHRIANEKAALVSLLEKIKAAYDSPKTLKRTMLAQFDNRPMQDLSTQLSKLTRKKETLLVDFTEAHPDIIQLNDEIKALITDLENEVNISISSLTKQEKVLSERQNALKEQNKNIPEQALQLARMEREVQLQVGLFQQLKAKHQEVQIQISGRVEEVTVVRPALVPSTPINLPSKMTIVGTGIVLGIIIGVVLSFVLETLDTSIGTIEDVEALLGVRVQGLIPFLDLKDAELKDGDPAGTGRNRYLVSHYDPKSLAAESFRSLRANLQFVKRNKNEKSFVITSSFVQEGKTFSAINTAMSMAQSGEKVLLVEADLRKPAIYKMFGITRTPGLTDFVLGNYQWKDIVNNITDVMLGDLDIEEILRTQGLDNLHIMTAGAIPPNPSEIIRSVRFTEFLQEAYEQYSFIFIDAPPILPVADATEIAPNVDGVLLVYKVGQIGRGVLKRAKASLDNVNVNITGIILNNVRPEIGPDYFKYHTQYYYGRDKKESVERQPFLIQKFLDFSEFVKKRSKYFPIIALVSAIMLLIFGIFWKAFS